MNTIKWDVVGLDSNRKDFVKFANGELSLRKLMAKVDGEARHELRTKIERGVGVDSGRRLLRRAMQRRGLSLV